MSHGGIIISSNSDGRGMMLPEREGSYTFNKLPFISMSNLKNDVGLNPTGYKVIINKKKLKKIERNNSRRAIEDRLFPLKNYRKIKTSQQFWKKNENPFFKKFNKKKEDEKTRIEEAEKYEVKGKNTFSELNDGNKLNFSDIEYIKSKKIFSAPKTPEKLVPPLINNYTLSEKKDIKEKNNEKISTTQPETKDVKVCVNDINNKNNVINDKEKDNINNDKNIEIVKDKEDKEDKEEKKENKEIKDPLLEDDLDDKENIDDVISYLNGLDYDKYCKDMEIREALTLLKHKMDKEKEEQKISEEKAQNKITIEGKEQPKEEENKDKDKDKEKKEYETITNNKTLLPEINNKIPEQNKVEIVDEEEEKRKEEIKKYKRAEQIAKSDQMKAVHSVSSIKKLLEREGLDKLSDQPPLKITVIKENPLANKDELQTNKLPFLHSLPLV